MQGYVRNTRLRVRSNDLEAVARVTELQAGRPHPLTGDWRGQVALDLAGAIAWCSQPSWIRVRFTTPGHRLVPSNRDLHRVHRKLR